MTPQNLTALLRQPSKWRWWLVVFLVVLVVTESFTAAMSWVLIGTVSVQSLIFGVVTTAILAPLVLLLARYLVHGLKQQVRSAKMESIKLQQTIIDAAPMRVFWKGRDLRYLGCNQAFATDAGMAYPADLVGKDDFQMGWAEQAELYRADDRAVMESGIPRLSFDEPQTTPDGQTIWLRTSKVPLKNMASETIGILGIYEDITERKLMQDTLVKTQDQLVQAGKLAALGSMVAGISHELNTPIGNSLMAASTLSHHTRIFSAKVEGGQLRRSLLNNFLEDTSTASELLMRSLGRAAELINHFKQLAVAPTHSEMKEFQLGVLVEELLLSLQPTLQKTPFAIVTDIPSNVLMVSFPDSLQQVISNFFHNAILHGFDGRQTGEMQLTATLLDKGLVQIRFRDNGVGIEASNLARVWDPFFTTKMGRGTGLGLNIVHNIVTGPLGGTLEVASDVGLGTTFTMVLPLVVNHTESRAALPCTDV